MFKVKDISIPELNDGQHSLLNLFLEEHEDSLNVPSRLDKVEIYGEDLLLYASQFIDLEPHVGGTSPHRQLQIMTVYRMYDPDDPYCDIHEPPRYREIMLSNPWRTEEGNKGWIIGSDENGPIYIPDMSDLHTDWV